MSIAGEDTQRMGVNCINNRGGVGRVDSKEHGKSLGCIDGKEGVRGEGGGLLNYSVYGTASMAVKEVAVAMALAEAASEVEVAEKCQLRRQPRRP